MKLSEFINQQATKAVVDFAADANKPFFDAIATLETEIPDELAKAIDNKFITIEAAKNNHPEIKNHYQSQALDTIEKNTIGALKELGVSQDEIDQLLTAEQSTFKRVPLALKKIKDLEAKKANASKPDQAAIQKQIDDLHASVRAKEDEVKKVKEDYAAKEKQDKIDRHIDRMFAKVKTVYDNLDPEDKNATLRSILNRNLQNSDALIQLNENGNLVLVRKDGTNYFAEGNRQQDPSGFLDAVLSKNKILVATAPPAPGGATPPLPKPPAPPSGNGGRNNGPSATVSNLFKEQTEQALKDLKNSAQPV